MRLLIRSDFSSYSIALILLCMAIFIQCSCTGQKVDVNPTRTSTVYVVGFDPFTANYLTKNGRGFVLKDTKTLETMLTYNIPDTLFDFPQTLFADYRNSYLFPIAEYTKFKIELKYRYATEKETVVTVGTADINIADFSKATQGNQVVVLSAREVL